ncbi:MAG TPA: hypothetical protein VFU80_03790, partial [Sphingomicrobium sp.]|nr:hypothetical protein [Sphingomicrobium sp.]
MTKRVGAGVLARLLCAAAAAALCSVPTLAQQPPEDPADVDASEPLDPMPDLGVDWPDLSKTPQEPLDDEPAPEEQIVTDTAERHYTITIDGLQRVGNAQALVEQFQKQSALYEGRRREANVAQVQRRSDTDAELLAEILRSQGF